jgi:hypothetical protein
VRKEPEFPIKVCTDDGKTTADASGKNRFCAKANVLAKLNPATRKIEHVRTKTTGETEPLNGDLSKGVSHRVLSKKSYYGYANLISTFCIFFYSFLKVTL